MQRKRSVTKAHALHKSHHPGMLKQARAIQQNAQSISRPKRASSADAGQNIKWQGLFLLAITMGAVVIDAAALQPEDTKAMQIPRTEAEKASYKHALAKRVCENKWMQPANKPSYLGMAGLSKAVVPVSCLSDQKQCARDKTLLHVFQRTFNVAPLEFARRELNAYDIWEISFKFKAIRLGARIQPELKADYFAIIDGIKALRVAEFRQDIANKAKMGNCDEQTLIALKTILTDKIQLNLAMKIQVIKMKNSASDELISGHICLLLDSDVEDVDLMNDHLAVSKYLRNIKRGKICDPWNLGKYADVAEDDSRLYQGDAGWDHLIVKTVDLPLEKLKSFSEEFQQFVVKELNQLGIKIKRAEPDAVSKPCDEEVSVSSACQKPS